MPESVKDLVVRLAFEHGDTKAQISAINQELKMLDSGFAASAAVAAGFSGGLNQTGAAADQLRQKLASQQQLVERYGTAIEQANEKLSKSQARYQEVGRELDQLKGKYAEQESGIKQLEAALQELEAEGMKNTSVYAETAAQLDQLKAEHAETAAQVKQMEAAYARADKAVNRNAQAVMKLTTEQNKAKAAMAETEAALAKEEARLKHSAAAWERAAEAAAKFAKGAKDAGKWQTDAGKKLTKVSTAIVGLGVAAGKAAIDWESDFAGVRKTVNGTEADLKGIEQALLDMQVPTDYSDLADIAANAGQLGIATENVVGFTRTMADLAETTDLTAEAAATGFAQYANITGMPQENIDRLGSVTVELGNNLATTESKIVNFAQAIGAAGHQAGMTDQQIFGISGGLASLGLEAQAGGTAFSKAIIGMKVAAETGSEDLQKYAKVAGMTADQFKQSFSQDAAGTFIQFVQGLASGSQSAIVMLDEMGITETRLRDTLLRASNASSLMTKSVAMANQAWTENTALQNEAAVRYQTTASRMKMTGKQAQRVAMDFGTALMPSIEQGLNGIQGIIGKFNGLSEAQRASIVKWGAYAAAVGPALTVLGKANTAIGTVASGFSQLATAVASGGGLAGTLSSLGSLLGPAGVAALVAGLGLAAVKLVDVASGAKAARDAIAAMNEQARTWRETQAETMYDTGNADPLQRFGLTKDSFGAATKAGEDWLDSLITTWTDGKRETDDIVKQYAEGFKSGSDEVRAAIEGQADTLSQYGAMTPEARANLDRDLKQLDAYDREVESLLKKRQNGLLTDDEKARLGEVLEARAELKLKYEPDTDGYQQIVTQMQAELERLRASGEGSDPTLLGDTMNALAEGRKAYNDALNQSYDAEYANIQAIEDEGARQQALMDLNARYNEQRAEGEQAYQQAVQEAATTAWQEGGYDEQVKQLDQLAAALGDMEHLDVPALKNLAEGLDEGQLTSMLALVEQLKESGMSDQQLLDLGIDVDDIQGKIEAIRDLTEGVEGLEGINEMIGQALPEELQRILVGLDMTQAAADWAAFASGGSLQPIQAGVEVSDTETISLTGSVSDIALAEGATFTADGSGNITTVTTKSGLTFAVDGNGNITTVTTPSGEVIDVTGNVTDVAWPEGASYTVDGQGNITGVTLADGTTFAVDGSGKVTSVSVAATATLPTLSATAAVKLSPLDQAAIAAWKAENASTTLEGPPAKVGVQLGAGWKEDLEAALDAGLLTVSGADGKKIEVTPEVVKQITATDVALLGEDGTIHVVITPEVGSEEGVQQSTEAMESTPLTGTPFEFMGQSAQDAVDKVNALRAAIAETNATIDGMKAEGQVWDDMGNSLSDLQASSRSMGDQLTHTLEGLTDADLEAIGGQIANLMAALQSGEGTPEQMAGYKAQLEELLSFVEGIDPGQYTSTGTNVAAGIAQGMTAYGWSGDAGTVAAAIKSAVDGALGVASPATTMVATGGFVSAGIGQGMTQYDFSGEAGAVASGIVSSFGSISSQAQSIGKNFSAGIASGIRSGRSGVISAAVSVATAAIQAAQSALQIHSPSKVTEGFGEMFDLGFVKGVKGSMPLISRAVADAVYPEIPARGYGAVVNQSTDNRDMSVSAPVQVQHMEVRQESDIDAISSQRAAKVRQDQRMVGAR